MAVREDLSSICTFRVAQQDLWMGCETKIHGGVELAIAPVSDSSGAAETS